MTRESPGKYISKGGGGVCPYFDRRKIPSTVFQKRGCVYGD